MLDYPCGRRALHEGKLSKTSTLGVSAYGCAVQPVTCKQRQQDKHSFRGCRHAVSLLGDWQSVYMSLAAEGNILAWQNKISRLSNCHLAGVSPSYRTKAGPTKKCRCEGRQGSHVDAWNACPCGPCSTTHTAALAKPKPSANTALAHGSHRWGICGCDEPLLNPLDDYIHGVRVAKIEPVVPVQAAGRVAYTQGQQEMLPQQIPLQSGSLQHTHTYTHASGQNFCRNTGAAAKQIQDDLLLSWHEKL